MPTLLLVEDDEDLAVALTHVGQPLGFEPIVVTTVGDALAQLAAKHIDVALVECALLDETCEPILDSIVARVESKTGVILTSSSPEMAAFAAAWSVPFLYKPFSLEVLEAALRDALADPPRPARPTSDLPSFEPLRRK